MIQIGKYMIDPTNIENCISFDIEELTKIAEAGIDGPLVNVLSVENNQWAIFGPNGVFVTESGHRTFPNIEVIHSLFSGVGLTRFIEAGEFKEF